MSEDQQIAPEELVKKIEELNVQLGNLQKQNEEYLDGWKRAKADYINFKNDQEKRSKELSQFASLALVMQLIPVLEHFRKAFSYITDDLKTSEWVKGIEQIYRQFKEVLKGMGVEEMPSALGKTFDPSQHMAVGQEQKDDIDDDIVSQEVEVGYTLHGKAIAPAKVIVNKKTLQNS